MAKGFSRKGGYDIINKSTCRLMGTESYIVSTVHRVAMVIFFLNYIYDKYFHLEVAKLMENILYILKLRMMIIICSSVCMIYEPQQ